MTQDTQVADAFMSIFGMRRVVRPTTEQMLKAMAQATDEQRRVLVAASTSATQKTHEGALKSSAGVLAGQGNKEKTQ